MTSLKDSEINQRERKFYQKIKSKMDGVHIQRIETTTGPGVPDLNMCFRGEEVWVELKVYVGDSVLLRKEQYAWCIRRAKAGGRVYVAAIRPEKNPDPKTGCIVTLFRAPFTVEPYRTRGKYVRITSPANHTIFENNSMLRDIFFSVHH